MQSQAHQILGSYEIKSKDLGTHALTDKIFISLIQQIQRDPEHVVKKVATPTNTTYKSLTTEDYKLEKYDHFKGHDVEKRKHISYLVPLETYTNEKLFYELKLENPIHILQQENSPEIFLQIIDQTFGRGGFGKVKGGHHIYKLCEDNTLQAANVAHSTAVKTIRTSAKEFTSSFAAYLDTETQLGKKYFGTDKVWSKKRVGTNEHLSFDIYMPELPKALDHLLVNGEIARLSYSSRFKLLYNVAVEIDEFHKKTGYLHNDLKPSNIAVDPKTLAVKLLDFGVSSPLGSVPKLKGHKAYRDPQLNENETIVKSENDFYSFAIITAQVLYNNDFNDEFINLFFDLLVMEGARHKRNHEFAELLHPDQLIEFFNALKGKEKRLQNQEIILKLNYFHAIFLQLENNETLYKYLEPEDQFKLARIQLIATCSGLQDKLAAKVAKQVLSDCELIKDKKNTASLVNVLRQTNVLIKKPSEEAMNNYHATTKTIANFNWEKLKVGMLTLLGTIAFSIGATMLFGPAAGVTALYPVLNSTIAFASALVAYIGGLVLAIGGTAKFFSSCVPKEQQLQNDMHKLANHMQPNVQKR